MVQKRPYGEEGLYEVSSKQPRQLEPSHEQVPEFEFPCDLVDWKSHISGEGGGSPPNSKPEYDEKHNIANFMQFPICTLKDVETCGPESASNSSWATSTTSEEDIRTEAPVHVLLSPDYDDHDHPISADVHSGEMYCTLLKHPPRKLVPVGKDFQAKLPEWGPHDSKDRQKTSDHSSHALALDFLDHCDDEDYRAGTCVIPMPDYEPSAYDEEKVGGGRVECPCEDVGSMRCVQQHITEAREKLRETLGQETFVKLGFCDMGEVVAARWSEEEEHLFHEVVFSNASSEMNFWDHLTVEFPSRTMRDIVSYYFNVFMLGKRAEQNRVDPLNIDSDNDEWQGTEDSDDEARTTDIDDDSVVESPTYQVDPGCNEIFEEDIHEDEEDVRDATLADHQHVNHGGVKGFSHALDEHDNCSFDHAFQPQDRVFSTESVEQDVQDGSCTSDEGGVAPETYLTKADYQKHWTESLCSDSNGHDLLLEPSSAKEWDVGYLSCPKKDVEFLPTCSMIEEVFGAGAWDDVSRDGPGLR